MTAAPQVRPAPKTISNTKSPRLDAAALHGIVQGDGDGGGGGVAVFVQVDEELVGPGPQSFPHGVNDAAVGLVRDDAFDLGDVQFAAAQYFLGRAVHGVDGALECFLAVFHVQEMHSGGKRLARGRAA